MMLEQWAGILFAKGKIMSPHCFFEYGLNKPIILTMLTM